jgi:hypothetical protein
MSEFGPDEPEFCIVHGYDHMRKREFPDRSPYCAACEDDAICKKADLMQVLEFLESIEGHGYGGMASFEIARMTVREAISTVSPADCGNKP